jgi:hypothetical protein
MNPETSPKPSIERGAEVKCVRCQDLIAVVAIDIHPHQFVGFDASMFLTDKGQGPWLNGQRMSCRKCFTPWQETIFRMAKERMI